MARQLWHFEIDARDVIRRNPIDLSVPQGSKFLAAGPIRRKLGIWFECPDVGHRTGMTEWRFELYEGQMITLITDDRMEYRTTVIWPGLYGIDLVQHLYGLELR